MRRAAAVGFMHDADARNDTKLVQVRSRLGMEGYGIYWALIEVMRENEQLRISQAGEELDALAFGLCVDASKIRAVIELGLRNGLFASEGEYIFSHSLRDRISAYKAKCEQLSQNALKRWGASDPPGDANALQMHSNGDANAILTRKKNPPILSTSTRDGGVGEEIRLTAAARQRLVKRFSERCVAFYERQIALKIKAKALRVANLEAYIEAWIAEDQVTGKNYYAPANDSARRQPAPVKRKEPAVPAVLKQVVQQVVNSKEDL